MQRHNGTPACASCKHQRKKCNEDCVLAPLFPVNRAQEFEAVHKVFGVSNVTKIVKNLKEEDRKSAADSLIWEAMCREKDPVLGPLGEFKKLYEELKLYKTQYQQFQQVQTQGGVMHKSAAPGFIGWNNNSKGMNYCQGHNSNDAFNYIRQNGNPLEGSCQYGQETENGSLPMLPHQQQSVNGFNQQYYLSG